MSKYRVRPPVRLFALALGLSAPAALCLAPQTAQAGDSCKTAADVSSKVWNETPKVVKDAIAASGPYGSTAMKAAKLIEEGIKIWNKIAGDDSWAKIGRRRLDFNAWHEGKLIGSTERLFVSGIPAVNPVQLDFHKLDNDGEVRVVVCKIPKKGTGKAKLVKAFTVKAGAKKGLIKSVKIDDAKGKVITVALHGKSFSKSLKYKVRGKWLYEEEEEGKTTYKAPPGTRQPDHKVKAPPGSREPDEPDHKVKGKR